MPILGGCVPLFDVLRCGVGPPDLLDGGGNVGFDGNFHGVPLVWDRVNCALLGLPAGVANRCRAPRTIVRCRSRHQRAPKSMNEIIGSMMKPYVRSRPSLPIPKARFHDGAPIAQMRHLSPR